MPSFETLPPEIKDQIYGYLLIHHHVIVPFPAEYERQEIEIAGGKASKRIVQYPRGSDQDPPVLKGERGHQRYDPDLPCISLLGVNHKIQREAAIVLFGKNIWRVSSPPRVYPNGDSSVTDNASIMAFYDRCIRYLRRVETGFDMRDLPRSSLLSLIKAVHNPPTIPLLPTELRGLSEVQRKGKLHEVFMSSLMSSWERKFTLLDSAQLDTLMLDFNGTFCPSGCCRGEAVQRLISHLSLEDMKIRKSRISFGYGKAYFASEHLPIEESGFHPDSTQSKSQASYHWRWNLPWPPVFSKKYTIFGLSEKEQMMCRKAWGLQAAVD